MTKEEKSPFWWHRQWRASPSHVSKWPTTPYHHPAKSTSVRLFETAHLHLQESNSNQNSLGPKWRTDYFTTQGQYTGVITMTKKPHNLWWKNEAVIIAHHMEIPCSVATALRYDRQDANHAGNRKHVDHEPEYPWVVLEAAPISLPPQPLWCVDHVGDTWVKRI